MDMGDVIFILGSVSSLFMFVFLIIGVILSMVKRTGRYLALILCVFLTAQLFSCQALSYGLSYDDVASPNYEMYRTMTFFDFAKGNIPYLIAIGGVTALCYLGINKKIKAAGMILSGVFILSVVFMGLCIVV